MYISKYQNTCSIKLTPPGVYPVKQAKTRYKHLIYVSLTDKRPENTSTGQINMKPTKALNLAP